jgi:hypothetical protein
MRNKVAYKVLYLSIKESPHFRGEVTAWQPAASSREALWAAGPASHGGFSPAEIIAGWIKPIPLHPMKFLLL